MLHPKPAATRGRFLFVSRLRFSIRENAKRGVIVVSFFALKFSPSMPIDGQDGTTKCRGRVTIGPASMPSKVSEEVRIDLPAGPSKK